MIIILSQKIKRGWQWILIPAILIAEFIIDQACLPLLYSPIVRHLNMPIYSKYILDINIYKITSVIVICLLNYWIMNQTFFWKPDFQEFGWKIFMIVSAIILVLSVRGPHFWIALDVGIIAATSEELLFRGVILGKLLSMINSARTSQVKVNLAVIGSAVIFGLYHYINLTHQSFGMTTIQVVNAIGIGMILAVIYVKSGSLLIPMTLHFIYDYAVTSLKGMPMNDYSQMVSGAYMSVFILLAIYTALSLYALNYHYENNQLLAKSDLAKVK